MAAHVEGDWKNFSFKMVQPQDYPKIAQYLIEHFYKDEPIKQLSPTDDVYPEIANERIIKKMDEHKHLCFMGVDKESGEIAGLQLQFKWTKAEAQIPYRPSQNQPSSEGIPPVRRILDQIHEPLEKTKLSIFDRYNVDYVAWNFLTSTSRKFRKQGLATEMYRRMVPMLKAEGFSVVFSLFSSPYSRRCAEKTGFIEIDRVVFSEIKDSEGNKVLPKATKDDFSSIMVLKIV